MRRESYIGEWLPEPLLTDESSPDAAAHAEDADSLSMAFLLLLERLSPVERAVFLLHDVFDYGYDEVAGIVGKSEDNCRQLAVRARRHVDEHKPRFEASRRQRERLATRFFDAVEEGDVDGLVELLAADVVVYGDGGGTSPSWRNPIYGRDKVVRLMLGLGRQSRKLGRPMRRAEINGQPGVLFLDPAGRLMHVMTFDIADGVVQTMRGIINPTSCGTSARSPTCARCCTTSRPSARPALAREEGHDCAARGLRRARFSARSEAPGACGRGPLRCSDGGLPPWWGGRERRPGDRAGLRGWSRRCGGTAPPVR